MWTLVVVFSATGGAFTIPGYSTEKCKAAESEPVGELNNANEQIGSARPILYTARKHPE